MSDGGLVALPSSRVGGGFEAVDEFGLDEENFAAALEESDSVGGCMRGGWLL